PRVPATPHRATPTHGRGCAAPAADPAESDTVRVALLLLALAAACDHSPSGPYPQVLNQDEGPVLTSPRVVPVVWSRDPMIGSLEDFLHRLVGSRYWTEVTAEYGVGALRFDTAGILRDSPPAPITFDWVRSFITDSLAAGRMPPVDDQTIYALLYPIETTAAGSCTQFGGYHEEIVRPGDLSIVYAVIVRCPASGDLSSLDLATSFLSHELIEAATDPYVRTQPAFDAVAREFFYWAIRAGGAELTDMCYLLGKDRLQRFVGPYLVQRSWSNREAAAGHEPCVPVP